MEGFGQHTTFHLKLTEQTWSVFHQRREQEGWEEMVVGHLVGRGHLLHPAGQRLGWCCCSWPLLWLGLAGKEGFGARSKGKGPALLQSNSSCSDVCLWATGRNSTAALRLSPLLSVPPLALPPSCVFLSTPSSPFSPHVFSSLRGCSFPTLWPLMSCSPTANAGGRSRN